MTNSSHTESAEGETVSIAWKVVSSLGSVIAPTKRRWLAEAFLNQKCICKELSGAANWGSTI